jgi:hypothetical protein
MSSEDLNDLASALGQFRPTSAVNRDRLMFEAGRASMPTGWKWPLAAGVSLTIALCLGLGLLLRPTPQPIIQTVYVPVPTLAPVAPPPPQPPPEPGETTPAVAQPIWPDMPYYRLQEQLSRWGLDAVPPPPHTEALGRPQTMEALMKSFEVDNGLQK